MEIDRDFLSHELDHRLARRRSPFGEILAQFDAMRPTFLRGVCRFDGVDADFKSDWIEQMLVFSDNIDRLVDQTRMSDLRSHKFRIHNFVDAIFVERILKAFFITHPPYLTVLIDCDESHKEIIDIFVLWLFLYNSFDRHLTRSLR